MNDATERLCQSARNEATCFALRDLCNDQQKEIESLRQRVAAQDELLQEMGEALEKIDAEYMTLPQYACESIAKYREMRK